MVHATAVVGLKGGRLHPGSTPLAVEASRMHGGHPEGFGSLYRCAAELISAGRAGRTPERSAKLTPNVLDRARARRLLELR
jgi:hypothetical protein